jgi:hypothetical protein
MEWMPVDEAILAPWDQAIGAREILRKQAAESPVRICGFHVDFPHFASMGSVPCRLLPMVTVVKTERNPEFLPFPSKPCNLSICRCAYPK